MNTSEGHCVQNTSKLRMVCRPLGTVEIAVILDNDRDCELESEQNELSDMVPCARMRPVDKYSWST